jgi:hypothetical protein
MRAIPRGLTGRGRFPKVRRRSQPQDIAALPPDASPARGPGAALLKFAVIGMGVLIVVGVAALGYGLATRGGSLMRAPADAQRALAVPLGLPAGTQVRHVAMGERGVAIHVEVPGQGPQVFVVPLSGAGPILRIAVTGEAEKK